MFDEQRYKSTKPSKASGVVHITNALSLSPYRFNIFIVRFVKFSVEKHSGGESNGLLLLAEFIFNTFKNK